MAAIASTINSHSGYHFPFMPSPEAHDFHHLKVSIPHLECELTFEFQNTDSGTVLLLNIFGICSSSTNAMV